MEWFSKNILRYGKINSDGGPEGTQKNEIVPSLTSSMLERKKHSDKSCTPNKQSK